MSNTKKRTTKNSIAPPHKPKHRSLANEEIEAFSRFWHSQKALPATPVRIASSIYARSKSSPGSTPTTPLRENLEHYQQSQRLLELLTTQRPSATDTVPVTRASIRTPMTRLGALTTPPWQSQPPPSFGPCPKSESCGYYGKTYKVMQLKDALEVLVLKKDLETKSNA